MVLYPATLWPASICICLLAGVPGVAPQVTTGDSGDAGVIFHFLLTHAISAVDKFQVRVNGILYGIMGRSVTLVTNSVTYTNDYVLLGKIDEELSLGRLMNVIFFHLFFTLSI